MDLLVFRLLLDRLDLDVDLEHIADHDATGLESDIPGESEVFAVDLGEPIRPYERLLYAGLNGDRQLFARVDNIEQTWRIVQPLLDEPGEIHYYDCGSWGPDAAHSLLRGHHGWQPPWLPHGTQAKQ